MFEGVELVTIFNIVGSSVAIFLGALKIHNWLSKPKLEFEIINSSTGIHKGHTFFHVWAQINLINKGKKAARIKKIILNLTSKEGKKEEISVIDIKNFKLPAGTSEIRNEHFLLSNFPNDQITGRKHTKITYVDIYGKTYVADLGELAFEQSLF